MRSLIHADRIFISPAQGSVQCRSPTLPRMTFSTWISWERILGGQGTTCPTHCLGGVYRLGPLGICPGRRRDAFSRPISLSDVSMGGGGWVATES